MEISFKEIRRNAESICPQSSFIMFLVVVLVSSFIHSLVLRFIHSLFTVALSANAAFQEAVTHLNSDKQ